MLSHKMRSVKSIVLKTTLHTKILINVKKTKHRSGKMTRLLITYRVEKIKIQ
jgi:hypothetical protein